MNNFQLRPATITWQELGLYSEDKSKLPNV